MGEGTRVTVCPDANDQLLYFTSTSLLADDRHLVVISDRTGHPNLFCVDAARWLGSRGNPVSRWLETIRALYGGQSRPARFRRVLPQRRGSRAAGRGVDFAPAGRLGGRKDGMDAAVPPRIELGQPGQPSASHLQPRGQCGVFYIGQRRQTRGVSDRCAPREIKSESLSHHFPSPGGSTWQARCGY